MENRLVRCLLMTAQITSLYGKSMNDLLPRCGIKSCLSSDRSLIKFPSPSIPTLSYIWQLKPEVLFKKELTVLEGGGGGCKKNQALKITFPSTREKDIRFRESRPNITIFAQVFLKYFHKNVSFDIHFDDNFFPFLLNLQKK